MTSYVSFMQELEQTLNPSIVHLDAVTKEMHSADALNPARAYYTTSDAWAIPVAVLTPTSTTEVVTAMRLANKHGVPVVPFGGGTGVMGAAVPLQGSLVIDLKNLNHIRSISTEDRTAWVESGVVLKNLNDVLNERGLMLGHDPWSTPIATVGGAISTDGVGYRAARYGSMGAQVLGLEVVLPSGDLLTTKPVPKNASGPRLESLFIGAEGTFGIITAATLRVFQLPEERHFATYSFSSFEDGFLAVTEMYGIGLKPAVTDLTEEPTHTGEIEILLYLTYEGYREEVAAQEVRVAQICREHRGIDIGPERTQEYWAKRHESGERYKKEMLPLLPRERWTRRSARHEHWDYLHLALPISKVLSFKQQAETLCREAGISIVESAIWTEPELFSMIMTQTSAPVQSENLFQATVDQILKLAQDMDGTIEYCHGVGLKLSHLIDREWGSGLKTARSLKKALDPRHLMNPGKLGL